MVLKNKKIAIVGLGYVGLPLAVEFGKVYQTIGYDLSSSRINELNNGVDKTGETSKNKINSSLKLTFTHNTDDLSDCDIYIIAVPTPIDKNNIPNLKILLSASKLVGSFLDKNNIVIYESTVYPGCTEEDCVPVLEKESKLKYNEDFFCGYSPERINPGDKKRTLTKIVKITSGSNPEIADIINNLYLSIVNAGTYMASSIKVAEAAKVIENCQRDINIAFVNELSIIFNKIGLDTNEVLDAASTKWNFLPFRPGLVGGHCIGVDPYYLTYKADKIGYNSKIILSGRKLNDSMPSYIANQILSFFNDQNKKLQSLKGLILGVTFKEDCADIRNTKVVDIYRSLHENNISIDVYDPYADREEVENKYNIELISFGKIKSKFYDFILVAVSHKQFINLNLNDYCKDGQSLVYDVKGTFENKNYLRL